MKDSTINKLVGIGHMAIGMFSDDWLLMIGFPIVGICFYILGIMHSRREESEL